LFSLPTINSLLCIVNHDTLMADQDMGEIILNFHLHSDTVRFAGIDMGPLGFASEEGDQRWMCWKRNLMGFKASLYNLIHMYLVAEEVKHGDHHDHTNAFQWMDIVLNLLGTREYKLSGA
jgi:hypothetical protein